jgi:hypothetical protein
MPESKVIQFRLNDAELERKFNEFKEKNGLRDSDACRTLISKGFLLLERTEGTRRKIARLVSESDLTFQELFGNSEMVKK